MTLFKHLKPLKPLNHLNHLNHLKPLKFLARVFAYIPYILVTTLIACSSSKDIRRMPTPLAAIQPTLEVKQIWKVHIGAADRYLLQPIAVNDTIYAAAADGTLMKIDATNGQPVWRKKLPTRLSAGVGSDGEFVVVGDLKGGLTLLDTDGTLRWQAHVNGEMLTSPQVGYGFVLARTVDGRITAFDAKTSKQQWVFYNHPRPLGLRTTLGMTFAGSQAVIAGFPGGTLIAISLSTGEVFWQTPVSYPSGFTEVERINDITGAPTLIGRETCAVTFQGRIGCFNVETGQALWKHAFSSYGGLTQDEATLVAANDWSVISCYDSITGKLRWDNATLKGRKISPPAIFGETVVVGDYQGFVHFLSRESGEVIARVKTDHHAITAQPILAGQTLVIQTQGGWIYGFKLAASR